MSTRSSRKRARAHDDEDGDVAEAQAFSASTVTAKKQRLAKAASGARRERGESTAQSSAAAAGNTPKTPRTVNAVASAISGALAYGVGSLLGVSKTRGAPKKLAIEDIAEYSEDGDTDSGSNVDDELLAATPTRSRMLSSPAVRQQSMTTPRTRGRNKVTRQASDEEEKEENEGTDELGENRNERPDDTLSRQARRTPSTPSRAETAVAAPPSSRQRKKRDPLAELAIAGTEKLKGGADTDSQGHDRTQTPVTKQSDGVSHSRSRARAETEVAVSLSKKASRPAARPETTTPGKRGRGRSPSQPASQKMVQQKEATEEAEQSDEDDAVCQICGLPDSEPPNEIFFCDGCDKAVHQKCYNVPVIPEGDWFCKDCVKKRKRQMVEEEERQQEDEAEGESEDEDGPAPDAAEASANGDSPATKAAAALHDPAEIANFDFYLSRMKHLLLGRFTGRYNVKMHGQDAAYEKVHQVLEQTIVAGEGNSMLLIGGRGTGKTAMVQMILKDLAAEHKDLFHVVRLNGYLHTDDKIATREIWRQLGKEMAVEEHYINQANSYADVMASLLSVLAHPTEIYGTSLAADIHSKSVVIVLDEFDLFAFHGRQALLYNLFDIAQSRKAPIAVLGLTTRPDVVELFEKRVKSRFSHRYAYLSLPRSLPAYWDICRHGLVAEDEGHDDGQQEGVPEFLAWWSQMIDAAKDDKNFQDQLAFHYYSSKSVADFWTACITPLLAVSRVAPRLQLPPVGGAAGTAMGGKSGTGVRGVGRPALVKAEPAESAAALSLDDVAALPLTEPNSKLDLLAELAELELALLIVAARLDIVLNTDTVNFAAAYEEYVSLMTKHRTQAMFAASGSVGGRGSSASGGAVIGGGARIWGRGIAMRAWERLVALGLLLPVGAGSSRIRAGEVTGSLEGRMMWRSEIKLEEIPAAPGVRLSSLHGRWCKEI